MLVAQKKVEVPHQLLERLSEARVRTDEIFDIVRPDSLYERPIPERHRIIFYLGHLEAFDWNLLRERVLGLKAFHAEFDKLFAFGIDPVNGALPSDQPIDWPSVADARHYVKRIRASIDEGLAALTSADWNSNPVGADFSAETLLDVAIEHRLMHAETLAYMLHQLPLDRKIRKQRKPELIVPPIAPTMIEIPAGRATLGLSRDDKSTFRLGQRIRSADRRRPGVRNRQVQSDQRPVPRFRGGRGLRESCMLDGRGLELASRAGIFAILCFGAGLATAGITAPCSTKSLCLWTGPCT